MRRRRLSRTIDVEVEIGDILSELSEGDLLEELKSRGADDPNALGCDRTDVEQALDLMRSRQFGAAMTLLERVLYPKFQSRDACAKAVAEIRARAPHL